MCVAKVKMNFLTFSAVNYVILGLKVVSAVSIGYLLPRHSIKMMRLELCWRFTACNFVRSVEVISWWQGRSNLIVLLNFIYSITSLDRHFLGKIDDDLVAAPTTLQSK